MKFIILSLFFCIFQISTFAEMPFNKGKSGAIVHIEHPDHIPHHPVGKDPTEQGTHDGIMYPRKRIKRGILEGV